MCGAFYEVLAAEAAGGAPDLGAIAASYGSAQLRVSLAHGSLPCALQYAQQILPPFWHCRVTCPTASSGWCSAQNEHTQSAVGLSPYCQVG